MKMSKTNQRLHDQQVSALVRQLKQRQKDFTFPHIIMDANEFLEMEMMTKFFETVQKKRDMERSKDPVRFDKFDLQVKYFLSGSMQALFGKYKELFNQLYVMNNTKVTKEFEVLIDDIYKMLVEQILHGYSGYFWHEESTDNYLYDVYNLV